MAFGDQLHHLKLACCEQLLGWTLAASDPIEIVAHDRPYRGRVKKRLAPQARLLALDRGSDTYYSIEVQLGEIDASHSFRVFDYWARNRIRIAGKTHVAVLMAENASGRFRPALEALAETVPLVVIELRCWQGDGEALLIPDIVIANRSLDLSDTPTAAATEERTEADWRQEASEEVWAFNEAFVLGDRAPWAGSRRLRAEVVCWSAGWAAHLGPPVAPARRCDRLSARPRRLTLRRSIPGI